VDMLGAKTVGMLTMDNDFGRTLAAGFKDYVTAREPRSSMTSLSL